MGGYGGVTHTGKVREHNEDSLALRPDLGLYIVADGMGGAARGDLASKIVVETLPALVEPLLVEFDHGSESTLSPFLDIKEPVVDAIKQLSIQVRDTAARHPEFQGMGSTVVLVLVRDGHVLAAHMGDSRAYALKNGELTRLTRDHSVVQFLVESGEISAKDAESHPAKNQITQCVGMEEEPLPDVMEARFQPGDRLLLCTDGLTSMVADTAIKDILEQGLTPEETCELLVTTANEAGGVDNITAVIVDA